ncbi:LVIVD repeat-containing protein [Algoriphagus namhaensis]
MKIKQRFLFITMGLILAFSCSDDADNPINDPNILINTDSEALSARLTREGTGVLGVTNISPASGRVLDEDLADELSLILVAQAPSPTYNGNTLRATHVDIDGDYAYVSYNTEGPTYLGGVEILDISNATEPRIVSQAIFTNADVSALEYRNGQLFLALAVDVDASEEATEPANLGVVSVNAGQFTSEFSIYSVAGFVGTDVSTSSEFSALVSGSNGLLTLFDQNQIVTQEYPLVDLRAVDNDDDRIVIFSGTEGVKILNASNLAELSSITVDAQEAGAKRTIQIEDERIFLAEGKNGAGIYRLSNGNLVSKIGIPINPENVEPGDIVTNAVSVDDELLFMANGAAGISIADVDDDDEPEMYGILDLDGSSNFVKNEDGFVFVATGAGGLQIIKIQEKEEGTTPSSCEGLATYKGNSNLNVNSNESQAYSGSTTLKNVNIGGNFLFCGSLAIENNLNVNSNGVMEVVGSFAFGQYRKNSSLNVNSNATLKLSGSTVIYGDLRLNSGATLEFVGEGNQIVIYGDVSINSGAKIIGDYTESTGKLD